MGELMMTSPRMDGAPSLPVVLMDGDERIHVGAVVLHPSQSVKKLQFAISQEIGVAPYQITSFLVRDRQSRIPINEKTDLGVVSRERGDWYVLAATRRPRNGRNRRGGSRRMKGSGTGFVTENPKPQPEKIILRRNDSGHTPVVHYLMPRREIGVNTSNIMPVWDQYYQAQIWSLQRERERYLLETRWTPNSGEENEMLGWDTWRGPEPSKTVCGVCEAAADLGVEAGFHRCVKDEVVKVGPTFFRSPVGPIERPSRNRVEGIA